MQKSGDNEIIKEEIPMPKHEGKGSKDGVDNPYKVSWFDKIPFWIKALVTKYWFFGMTYFFFVMGLGTYLLNSVYDPYLMMLVVGCATGFFNDFLVYNILGLFESNKHESREWVMYKNKKFLSLLINLVYGIAWAFATGIICALLVEVIPANDFGAFREPLTYALVGLIVDAFCITIKDLIVRFIKKISGQEDHV